MTEDNESRSLEKDSLASLPASQSVNGDARDLFCADLPSRPAPELGTILVTGATGYIGGRLIRELLARGYSLRLMVRGEPEITAELWPEAEVVVADALDKDSLRGALRGVYAAYYLIHSLLLGPEEFEKADIRAAANFRDIAEEEGLSRIIYLGGLGETHISHSRHLRNRMAVARELRAGNVPVTVLRAGIIIGSGSASYEIIHSLVSTLRVLPVPRWARNLCQPIGIRDVLKYLVGVLETPVTKAQSFDIGGLDVLSYEAMLRSFARVIGRKAVFIPSPISSIGLNAYIASLITPLPDQIISCLMEGLRDEVICGNEEIRKFVPFKPLSYKEAVVRALTREQQDRIHTRWSDAYPPSHELAMKLHEVKPKPRYLASYALGTNKDASSLFESISAVGGKSGWFNSNWLWRVRGVIDQLFFGVGIARGRRSQSRLAVNDVIDFWRVEDLIPDTRLLLRAEMKLPGKAWLEFNIIENESSADEGSAAGGVGFSSKNAERRRAGLDGERLLTVAAWFDTKTILGHAYWYAFLPFHNFIFKDLLVQIERMS